MSKIYKVARKSELLVETGIEKDRYSVDKAVADKFAAEKRRKLEMRQTLEVTTDLDLRENLDLFHKTQFFLCTNKTGVVTISLPLPSTLPDNFTTSKVFLVKDCFPVQINIPGRHSFLVTQDSHHTVIFCNGHYFV